MFLFAASVWLLLRLFFPCFQLHSYGVWGQSDIVSLRELVMDPLFLRNLVKLSCMLILAPCPLSHRKMGDMVHCVFHLSGVVSLFLYRDVLEFKEDLIVMGMLRMVFAVVCGNTALVCILNLMHTIAFILHAALMNVPGQGEISLVVVPISCVVVSMIVETSTRSQARAQLTMMSSSQSETTVHDLLNVICDAVVFLDGDLKVTSPSQKLDGLLLRRTDPGELCGTPFTKYVLDSDVIRFQNFIEEETGHGHSLHVDMRDQGGAGLSVQLFHTAFHDLFGQKHHIVGVREEMDFRTQRGLPLADTPPPLVSSLWKSKGSPSSGSSDELVSIKSCDGEPVAVWVNVIDGDLPIVGCTASFTSVGGPVEQEESFLAWVKGDKSAFLLWVKTMLNDQNTESSRKVNLLPSRKNNIEIRTTCTIFAKDDDDSDDDSSEPRRLARIELTKIRIRQLKHRTGPLTAGIPHTGSAPSAARRLSL